MTALVLVALLAPQRVLLHTNAGDLIVALDAEAAPKTAAQFAKLTALGLYDSTRFLRVERNTLIQVGVVESRKKSLTDEQRNAIVPLPLEKSGPHRRGSVTMVRDPNAPKEGQTSFAILLADAPSLDGRHTLFAHVERGMEVADAIGEVDVDFGHIPIAPIEITSARVLAPDENPALAPPSAVRHRGDTRPHVPWFIGAMTLLCLGALGALRLQRPKLASALCVLAVFVGFFLLFTLLLPTAAHSRLLSVALLVGLVLSFRLVSGFEKMR